jgi:anti-sigma B factor antagonist
LKESKLKLSLDVQEIEEVKVVYCRGRITYREEATALSDLIIGSLDHPSQIVLEVSGVEMIDSAGLGELVVAFMWAQARGCAIKIAGPAKCVREVLELTNLTAVFEIYATLEDAILTARAQIA